MADTTANIPERFAADALDALSHVDEILAPAPGKIGFAELYAYAVDPAHEPAERMLSALDRDAALRADFQRLLKNTARYYMPQVAAASSGALDSREVDGCRIVFKSSRADPNQLYVIVEATADKTFEPEILFVQFPDGRTRRTELGGGRDGRTQILLDRTSEIAQGLMDINTEVYVK